TRPLRVVPVRPLLLALALALPGCLDGDAAAPAPATPTAGCDACGADATPQPAVTPPPVGRSWTYETRGVYDTQSAFTLVLAKLGPDGGLVAGATEADIEETIAWERPWAGPTDAQGNPERAKLFDWPLEDGKTWQAWEGLQVTARAATVQTPSGPEDGFVVEGGKEDRRTAWEYAPSVGWLVSYRFERGGEAYIDARLVSMGTAASWVWYERGPFAAVESGDAPAVLEVAEGYDAVVATGGGTTGRSDLVAPDGSAWSWQAGAGETWTARTLPATAGAWALAAVAPPTDGFSYMQAEAVRWVRGTT
ncbi:MAG TPA: hypothetical protein VHH36_05495, partial [Candidatus Thermoplasmatota archaeon]|nr:hypothetical protein [Candidatus Thermoplasmatota archaeon]